MTIDKITTEILRSWSPCEEGYKRFCTLFPEGADLDTAIAGLVKDGHDDWGKWLFDRCRDKGLFPVSVANGYRNTGYMNTGDRNTGDRNTGDRNTGYMNTGYMNTGYMNTGDRNTGDRNTGYMNTGDRNTGYMNTGYRNTGYRNTGDRNTGYMNTGYMNTGDMNTGDMNTGDRNTGDRNTGYMNTGYMNTGDMNTANYSTGFFNTITEDNVMVFNKPFSRKAWNDADKPQFIYNVLPNEWVWERVMTDEEKVKNPKFYVAEGYLKCVPMKDAWRKAWADARAEDRAKVFGLPNFDPAVFLEITGIDVNKQD